VQPAILGVDVGTSSLKGVVYDGAGAALFTTHQAYRLATPQPGWAELDMRAAWLALVAVLRDAAAATAGQARIAAVALAAQAGSVVPVDAAGEPLAPMITWLDRRAAPLTAAWQTDGTAARIRALSGWHPYPGLPIATIAWLTRHAPQVTARAHRYLGAHEFLVQRLTGHCITDYSEAAEMVLLDHRTGAWSPELCALAGIRPGQLAELAPAGAVVGPLLPEVAAATGLPADMQVVVGGHDQCCAALGMGATTPGELMLAAGTAWVLTALTPRMTVAQIPPGMDLNHHVLPELFTVSQLLGGFGATVEWWLDMVLPTADRAARFAALDAWLAASPPGAHGLRFLPAPGVGAGRFSGSAPRPHARRSGARAGGRRRLCAACGAGRAHRGRAAHPAAMDVRRRHPQPHLAHDPGGRDRRPRGRGAGQRLAGARCGPARRRGQRAVGRPGHRHAALAPIAGAPGARRRPQRRLSAGRVDVNIASCAGRGATLTGYFRSLWRRRHDA
jgi:sugar (pentulose or hexulose) kinase